MKKKFDLNVFFFAYCRNKPEVFLKNFLNLIVPNYLPNNRYPMASWKTLWWPMLMVINGKSKYFRYVKFRQVLLCYHCKLFKSDGCYLSLPLIDMYFLFTNASMNQWPRIFFFIVTHSTIWVLENLTWLNFVWYLKAESYVHISVS